MHKFFDYLAPDLPVKTIGELAGYIRRFAALFSGGVPVEGHMGGVVFCATEQPAAASASTGSRWTASVSRWTLPSDALFFGAAARQGNRRRHRRLPVSLAFPTAWEYNISNMTFSARR